MIIGIGTDICQLSRIEKLLKSTKRQHFLKKTLTQEEIDNIPPARREVSYCAGRWAAKEAVAKALGCGFGAKCRWLDITIRKMDSGAPEVVLSELTAQTAKDLGIGKIHVSISHEKEYAVAFVVAEEGLACPDSPQF